MEARPDISEMPGALAEVDLSEHLGHQVFASLSEPKPTTRASGRGDIARELPLVVLSGDHHASNYADWQRDLAQLSSRGRQLVASGSGHWIHLDRPELVIQAIREVVGAARSDSELEPHRNKKSG